MGKVIDIHSYALGDLIAFMPLADKYSKDHNIEIYILTNPKYFDLFKNSYPTIRFLDKAEDGEDVLHISYNFKKPLQQGYAEQLGYTNLEYIRPKIDTFDKGSPIKSKYMTFGVHSTCQAKLWNSPGPKKQSNLEATNWNELSRMLRKSNITPVCLAEYELYGHSDAWNGLPKKAVKKIGLDIKDVINYINHSEFYVGPSSGLSWVAHALGKKVAMISNFTEDWNEFDINLKDYKRITDKSVCNGCWHKHQFDKNDWYWCPVYKNTDREYECHKAITPDRVFKELQDWI